MKSNRRRLLTAVALGGTGLAAVASRLARAGTAGTERVGVNTANDGGASVDATGGSMTLAADEACTPLLSHALRPLTGGETTPLCPRFSDEVLLIVNTASRCGFTPQFESLETLHGRYVERGLRVLGFPSDDFRQELADEAEVAEFCRLNYGVTFPMFQKVHVTGEAAHPLYRELAKATGSAPSWNFNKYLVDRQGKAVAHYGSSEQPLGPRLVAAIEALL